ncbi:Zn(2)-C6 fungal-type domain-containing protein [[Candida] zeylanoides]
MEPANHHAQSLLLPIPEESRTASATSTPTAATNGSGNTSTVHKRRRVTRACDECRKKKVKCDGKQPCIHCTVYSYNCTYQSPNTRNRKSAIAPERQTITMVGVGAAAAAAGRAPNGTAAPTGSGAVVHHPGADGGAIGTGTGSHAAEMYKSIVQLMFPKLNFENPSTIHTNQVKFERVFSYLSKIKPPESISIGELTSLYLDGPSATTLSPTPKLERQSSVSSADDMNSIGREIKIILPSKEVALKLIYTTWNEACVLFRFYHRPSLLTEVDLLYSLDPVNYTDRQQKFLPFIYSVLACGSLFSKQRTRTHVQDLDSSSNEALEDDGFRYFMAARKLIDITNVGDIISIQTIVMMVLYLQCSARLSTCYSYIGIALRSALKEGLHRNLSIFQKSKKTKLTYIEIDTRKRLFYTIYKMDIYINSLLGLPRSIKEDEFDQEYPEELDDENITDEMLNYEEQGGRLSSAACANHHTKLMLIISHIVRDLYPIKLHKKNSEGGDKLTPEYIHEKVTEIELELKEWLDNLPSELKPTDPNVADSGKHIPRKFVLANFYLHLAFLNCQIMLYRPFIHFISNGTVNRQSDPRSLIRGRNCIKVARMVVKLANKMIDQNLLIGTYWFSMYTIFFSIACLIYYFHFANYTQNNAASGHVGVNYAGVLFDDDLNIDMIKNDIDIGKKVLDCLKNDSNSSLRIFNILKNLFEQLNRRTASTSRGKPNTNSIIQEGDGNGEHLFAQQRQEMKPQMTLRDGKDVESTFINFDSMNTFNAAGLSPSKPSDSFFIPSEPLTGNTTSKVSVPFNPVEPASRKTFGEGSNLVQPPPAQQSLPANDPSKYGNNAIFADDYMPGVIDKLDAQIFGRILPPYMLEKNAKYAEAVNGLANDSASTALNDFQANLVSGDNEVVGRAPPTEINELDFAQLENLMFDSSIEQLDPFNPLYSGTGEKL